MTVVASNGCPSSPALCFPTRRDQFRRRHFVRSRRASALRIACLRLRHPLPSPCLASGTSPSTRLRSGRSATLTDSAHISPRTFCRRPRPFGCGRARCSNHRPACAEPVRIAACLMEGATSPRRTWTRTDRLRPLIQHRLRKKIAHRSRERGRRVALRVAGLSASETRDARGAYLEKTLPWPRSLTAGERPFRDRRLLALALEWSATPHLLLSDEVTSGRDPNAEDESCQALYARLAPLRRIGLPDDPQPAAREALRQRAHLV